MGILDSAAQQQPPQSAAQQAPAASAAGPGQGLPPEKEEMVSKGYQLGRNLLYREDVFADIMKSMEDASPVGAVAEAIVFIVEKIQADMQPPFDVLLGIALALLADLVEALERTGRVQITQEQIPQALELAINMYLQVHGNQFNQDELRQIYDEGAAQFGGQQPQQPQQPQPTGGM
jgi:hypothetical protein